MRRWTILLLTMALVPGTLATAGDLVIETLLLEGDDVPGVGLVTRIDNLAINNAGEWLVEADTDNADTDADSVLLAGGVLLLQEGDALPEPVGATLDSFDTVNLNAGGDSGWNFFLDGTAGFDDDSGVYFNTNLLIQEGDVSTAPGFSPGTTFEGFFEAKINDDDLILLMATVDDPAIDSTVDRALMVLEVDAPGNLVSETVLFKEGDVLPGQTEEVTDFDTGPHNFDYNNQGDVLFLADLTGDAATNAAIYLGEVLLAQEGDPSPVAGRNWETLTSPELSLDNHGGYVFSGNLDGDSATDLLLVQDGAKLVQEGDTLPAIDPFLLTSFGSGPLLVSDGGEVLWFGDWDDPDTDVDTGLFLDQELLVQEGVTLLEGLLVDSLRGVQDGYAMSDDGRLILFEAELDGGIEGVFLITRETGLTLGAPVPGQAGMVNAFAVDGATPEEAVFLLGGTTAGETPVPDCPGLAVGIDDLRRFGRARADADGAATILRFIPAGQSGSTFLFQALDRASCTVSNLVEHQFD